MSESVSTDFSKGMLAYVSEATS